MRQLISAFLLLCAVSAPLCGSDWPMLAHDAARSGATRDEIHPPFERKWYRLFPDEGLMTGVQPVIAKNLVFVGTLHATLHAIDAESGRDAWVAQTDGPILHACAVAGDLVFFGTAAGTVQALRVQDGQSAWKVQTGAAVWNAPAVSEGVVYVGSRNGKLYAIESPSGHVKWTAPTGGPLLNSPAVDEKNGLVYIGSEDMHVYAFDLKDGARRWQSPKLPGVSLRGYHPVIAPDGSVIVTCLPGINVDVFQEFLDATAKQIFGGYASWRHSKEENTRLRESNFKQLEDPASLDKQVDLYRARLEAQPAFQTFFVLDQATGKPRYITPIVYSESMNGPGAPPLISPDGRVLVKFQALLRSRYEHYSPFLNVGWLDTSTGRISPALDESRTYGWTQSLLLVHDEQCQLSIAGHLLINTHQDNVNGLDLQTREGFTESFAHNVHEPKLGEALGIWTHLLRNEPLPPGEEWLQRGTAVYGGGSVIDQAVSISGDSFYYLPTHELSAGCALIAYRMSGEKPKSNPETRPPELSTSEWEQVQKLPWDWDTLEMPRLGSVTAALPGKVPGTRPQPLTEGAAKVVAAIPDGKLDDIIWKARDLNPPEYLIRHLEPIEKLDSAVAELISQAWKPLLFPCGKHPTESYRIFDDPSETLYTVALAYPLLDSIQQKQVREWAALPHGLLSQVIKHVYEPTVGAERAAYDHPPENLLKIRESIVRTDLARLYPLWFWAFVSGDWAPAEKAWPALRSHLSDAPNPMAEDCHNGHIAGLIAACRIAAHLKDDAAVAETVAITRQALRERLEFELAHTHGGLIWRVPENRSIFSRWHFLTPEVGQLLSKYAGPIHRDLMANYVDHHRPTWWLAWNVETMFRNEAPLEQPAVSADIFAARALILGEPVKNLSTYIDLPWCKADEYYIQKLTLRCAAGLPIRWKDTRSIH